MAEYFDKKVEKIPVFVAPCLNCGSSNIRLYDCGYSSFNMGGGECKDCKRSTITSVSWYQPSNQQLADIWNSANNIDEIIKGHERDVIKSQEKIKELKALKRSRARKPK